MNLTHGPRRNEIGGLVLRRSFDPATSLPSACSVSVNLIPPAHFGYRVVEGRSDDRRDSSGGVPKVFEPRIDTWPSIPDR